MIYEGRSFFSGKLDGKTLKDFFINRYDLETAKERIAAVEELLQTTFFDEYFDKHFKVKLNGSDQLSSGINVCQSLEKLADYILNCKEIRDERKNNQVEYRIYKNQYEFYERTKRESNVSDDKILDFLKDENKNHYLSNDQVITTKDLEENSECGEILRQYNIMLEQCKKIPKFSTMLAQSKMVREDMIITKNKLKGTFDLADMSKLNIFPDYDNFDWKNTDHVKQLLSVKREFKTEDNLSHLLLALDEYIKRMYDEKILDKQAYLIAKLVRKGYKQSEICEMLDLKKSNLNHKIKKIVEKISTYAEN